MGAAMTEGAVTGVLPPVPPVLVLLLHCCGTSYTTNLPGLHYQPSCNPPLRVTLQDDAGEGLQAQPGPSAARGAKKMADGAAEVAMAAGKAAADTIQAAAATAGETLVVSRQCASQHLAALCPAPVAVQTLKRWDPCLPAR